MTVGSPTAGLEPRSQPAPQNRERRVQVSECLWLAGPEKPLLSLRERAPDALVVLAAIEPRLPPRRSLGGERLARDAVHAGSVELQPARGPSRVQPIRVAVIKREDGVRDVQSDLL